MNERTLGIDLGAESLRIVELTRTPAGHRVTAQRTVEHRKDLAGALASVLAGLDWAGLHGVAATGRLSRSLRLPRVPEKLARAEGFRFLRPDAGPTTLVTIGSHGFSVLELNGRGPEVFRENSRCSQGTGNFLRQLVERFSLTIDEAALQVEGVLEPCPLSGRCPVILKTDMTHLANQGQDRARILAGLFDAVAENVEVLIKPRRSPPEVLLLGGVARSTRIRSHFAAFCERHGMHCASWGDLEPDYIDALGAALQAHATPAPPPPVHELLLPAGQNGLEQLPALSGALHAVRRLTAPPFPLPGSEPTPLVLGLDIGSTGSKAVALELGSGQPVWQGYLGTRGDPLAAARQLVAEWQAGPWGSQPLVACGVTGSGRELVGSLLTTCYGAARVFVLNEIAAHARGALHFDPSVDTIFEIGGQDAKYVRLEGGRVIDAAMNEACSAGTGSFIEEQGRRFEGIGDVVALGRAALQADGAISLGQHCSVFMAEIIDESVAAGEPRPRIIAGIYDSVVQNYLNRVKGPRPVGKVVFCQGMPFAADALAAAVAHRTGAQVIVPPHPGTIGALGIALLTVSERLAGLTAPELQPIDPERFCSARVLQRDTFVCNSTKGCGGAGNHCRIDRIRTEVEGQKATFTWGGGCALYDRGTGRQKLPDGTPDPFREREAWVDTLLAERLPARGRPAIALTDEFVLKGLFPFFATYLHGLGFDLAVERGADHTVLKRGIEEGNVAFCAPMQQYHAYPVATGGPCDYL